ncbi:amidohydrolase family protein [Caulobacter sp. 17J65-9]|uniref:amidohydrolase family protein n=1 Tax=Caulobacter sp. 17J65-9 TaxID=2709382 RepID=UPI0013C70161|nr:amidohydrolase family protein [Caulobacter sp. 17J65-9]NEX94108.1 amidohydrolase family protein [Caulobacter sp. 17J65-9]
MRKFAGAAALTLVLAAAGGASAAEKVDLLVRKATVVDVETGRLLPDRLVAVRDGTVVAVDADRAAKRFDAARVIDGEGKFVIPGLWDMHVHFGGGEALIEENKDLLPLYVANGVTTVRDCAGDLSDSVLAWRAQVANGELLGPTIFTSGPKLEGINSIWPGDLEVGSEAEVRAGLDKLQAMHVDFVKITDNTLKPELFLYALGEAKARGLKTSAHVPLSLTIDQIEAAGLGSIEHVDYALKSASPQDAEISAEYAAGKLTYTQARDRLVESFDPKTAEVGFRKLAQHGVAITPTLNGGRVIAYLDQEDHAHDPYLRYLGPGLKATYAWRIERAAKDDAAAIAARHRRAEQDASLLPLLQKAGVMLMAGTDAGFLNSYNYPGVGLHDELKLFVDAGLTPLQTLQAATLAGPKFLGQTDRYGAVAPGKAADLVILDRDPLKDISATRAINGVVLHGKYLDRAALDGLMQTAADKVAAAEAKH